MEKKWGDTPSVTLKLLQKIYSKFCIYIAFSLTHFTRKFLPNKTQLISSQEIAFQNLKLAITKSPILKRFFLKFSLYKPIHPIKDLVQYLNRRKVIISSKWLKPSEKHYFTIEKKCLGIVRSILKFHRYFCGKEFILEGDQGIIWNI